MEGPTKVKQNAFSSAIRTPLGYLSLRTSHYKHLGLSKVAHWLSGSNVVARIHFGCLWNNQIYIAHASICYGALQERTCFRLAIIKGFDLVPIRGWSTETGYS